MNKLLIGMFIFISLLIFTVYTVHSEEDVWQLKKPTITIGELEYKQANK
jgi:hypothetical protein